VQSDCDPINTVTDLGNNMTLSGVPLNSSNATANPCGLIAKSLFTDGYNLTNQSDPTKTAIFINETGIAWASDKSLKYARPSDPAYPNNPGANPNYYKTVQWHDVMDEHFMVWMRPAGLPNFRKLWGRINNDLAAGTYTLSVNNTYDVSAFSGQKFFVLSTVNAFGGKNAFLGISYIVVGSICILMAILFLIGYKIHNSQKKQF